MAVRVPATGAMIRELVHCGQFIQSHALSFFHLSAPDLLLGMDSDPVKRNVLGLAQKRPELVRDGIELRKFGQTIIQLAAGERVHPPGLVPGGVMAPLEPDTRDKILAALPKSLDIAKRTLDFFKSALGQFQDEIAHFGDMKSLYAGLVDQSGRMKIYDGQIRFRNSEGDTLADFVPADQYREYIGEASLGYSYLKAPYFRQLGYPEGMYRVGPLARLNVADSLGTPAADAELSEYRQRFGRVVSSSFLYHYARLIELLYSVERAQRLLETPAILDRHVRAHAAVNALEGVGMSEAPRGILIHHYKVDESGAITWANLIIATGHNNLALNRSIEQVSKHYVNGNKLQEGMLNRVSAVVRAYDPCLSCSTHADGMLSLDIRLIDPQGDVLDEIKT
jgi:NAD-reducing hydrogenase large subunit